MKKTNYILNGVIEYVPDIHKDDRGYFLETYNKELFGNFLGIETKFIQDNQSKSQKDVLRGLHFQKPPHTQAKLVSVITGSVMDVIVDLRKDSSTYGQHGKYVLNSETKNMLYVPEGFAHGFLTLEEDTIFTYKCSKKYNKESEGGIRWNDPSLKIDWNIDYPIISEKDQDLPLLKNIDNPF